MEELNLFSFVKKLSISEWWLERKWLKSKPCAACKNFEHFMGSAGVCNAKCGCPADRMKDYSDSCDCGRFKKRSKK